MKNNIYIYIFIMAAVCFAIRTLPLTLIQRRIKNRFVQSFLFYVPYVTLAVMTFPTIIYSTKSPVSGVVALIIGIVSAWKTENLFKVAAFCCISVLVCDFLLSFV